MKALTIYYDRNDGELKKISFSKEFKSESALMRADVLKDATEALDVEYEKVRARLFGRRKEAGKS